MKHLFLLWLVTSSPLPAGCLRKNPSALCRYPCMSLWPEHSTGCWQLVTAKWPVEVLPSFGLKNCCDYCPYPQSVGKTVSMMWICKISAASPFWHWFLHSCCLHASDLLWLTCRLCQVAFELHWFTSTSCWVTYISYHLQLTADLAKTYASCQNTSKTPFNCLFHWIGIWTPPPGAHSSHNSILILQYQQ